MTAFLIAAAAAALAGMGIGGGGLLVIWLTAAAGMETQTAQGVNLLFFIVSALSALPYHLKKRRIPWRPVLVIVLSALPGAVLGASAAARLNGNTARLVFGWFLILSSAVSLRKLLKRAFRRRKQKQRKKDIRSAG